MKTSASALSSPRELAMTRRSATAERLLAAIGGSPTHRRRRRLGKSQETVERTATTAAAERCGALRVAVSKMVASNCRQREQQ